MIRLKKFMNLLILFILVFGLISCVTPGTTEQPTTPTPQTAPTTDRTTTVQESSKGTAQTKPQVVVETQQPADEIPPSPSPAPTTKTVSKEEYERIQKVLSRADEKVKSYSFTYAPPPDNLARDKWFIRGTKILVELFEDNYITPDEYYDTIYIDTTEKIAHGFCEDPNRARCADPNKRFTLKYGDVMIKTPYQWLKEVENAEEIGTELVYDRSVLVVRYKKGTTEYYQWIDQFSGLPVRVAEGAPPHKQLWEFRYLAINNVAEDRVLRAGS